MAGMLYCDWSSRPPPSGLRLASIGAGRCELPAPVRIRPLEASRPQHFRIKADKPQALACFLLRLRLQRIHVVEIACERQPSLRRTRHNGTLFAARLMSAQALRTPMPVGGIPVDRAAYRTPTISPLPAQLNLKEMEPHRGVNWKTSLTL